MSPDHGAERGVFVNRTLNLRSIRAIGYDLDYTLVHYDVAQWEARAFEHARRRLEASGWPTRGMEFDATAVTRGLAIDLEEGNLVKATRFGYVIRATHGTRVLEFDEIRSTYQGILVDLSEPRFVFINVLFSLSEASLFAKLVDIVDAEGRSRGIGYAPVYAAVRKALDAAHQEGDIKDDVVADPGRFIVQEPDTVLALLDQLNAGKRLMLITNAEWSYTDAMMTYAFDPFLPYGTWRDVFDTIIVSANKPSFFTSNNPLYKVMDEEKSLLSPHLGEIEPGSVFFGGCARQVEASLGLSGAEILYAGDHLFGDVHFTKALLRWRTALILRELESEVASAIEFRPTAERLTQLMRDKEDLEGEMAVLRLDQQRARQGYGPDPAGAVAPGAIETVRAGIVSLDKEIAPLAAAAGAVRYKHWGPLMRTGIDKSLFARQVERYADIYTSRVSNFLRPGPHAFLRAKRLDLPHDAAVREGE